MQKIAHKRLDPWTVLRGYGKGLNGKIGSTKTYRKNGYDISDYAMGSVGDVGGAAAYDNEMGQRTVFDSGRMLIFTLMRNPKGQNKALLIQLAQTTLSGP